MCSNSNFLSTVTRVTETTIGDYQPMDLSTPQRFKRSREKGSPNSSFKNARAKVSEGATGGKNENGDEDLNESINEESV